MFSTQKAINWFNRIDNKHKHKFIQVDIKEYYFSINYSALMVIIGQTSLSLKEINKILTTRKSFIKFDSK